MELSQEFDILDTHKSKIFVTTTGISELEKDKIKKNLPSHIILEDDLTPLTTYLISYKSIISNKFIQAMIWNIKFLSIDWLYDFTSNVNKYIMRPLEGIEFSSNDITNDIFINYYTLLGAVYNENLNIFTSFFISNSNEGEKIDFCKKYNIPIITSENIFKNNFKLIKKPFMLNALRVECNNMFLGKVIYIDPTLDKSLFNHIKKLIIEYDGIRVSVIDSNVDFIVTKSNNSLKEDKYKILHYQYIFDCVEYKAELMIKPYIIYNKLKKPVFKNVVCCLEKTLKQDSLILKNKLKALGSLIKEEDDITCTHLIIRDKREYKKCGKKPYKVVSSEWIDQCLYTMKHEKEDKYLVKELTLGLFSNTISKMPIKKIKASVIVEKVFQFTGLPSLLKNQAIEKLEKYNIKYIISERYENCTHLIMGNLSTSEKFLCSLSNGAWILTPDFINEFDNSKHFNYEKYEWKCDENTEEKDMKIIKSIKNWRIKVNTTGYPAFYKWKVKLYADDSKKENYKRVIENGGGAVVDSDNYTHCFVAKNYKGKVNEKKKYSTDYIFSYLFK